MPRSASIVLIGAHQLFADSVAEALRQEHDVCHIEELEGWLAGPATTADVIIVIAPVIEFGEIRARIRSAWQTGDDPMLLCLDEDDPRGYVSQVSEHHVTRRRLNLAGVLEIVTHQHSGI